MMALGLVFSWGCSRIEETTLPIGLREGVELTVKATLADVAGTRTVLNPDGSIYWTKDDAINLFYGDRSSGKFVSSVGDEPVKTTDFVGTLTVATGSSEEGMSAKAFWGVYPYDENNTCDGTGVTMTLPNQQEALAGSFADKLNPSVATSAGLDLTFYNVGAPFYFSVTQEGVTSATFMGNNNEDVAGKIRVSMGSDGKPVAEVLEGLKRITLTAPDGGFVPGETYVIVLLPQTQMTAGYTVTFKKGNLEAICVVSKSVPFERSKGRSKKNADEGLVFYDRSAFPLPEAVDLGLPSGLKWASFNLGASKPEGYGDYFAWGETETHYSNLNPLTWKEGKEAGYDWPSYKWCNGTATTMTKYCSNSSYGYNGFTDNKTILDPEDDAAYVNIGGKWRMPTEAEWQELGNHCTRIWTTQNGVAGCLFTAANGNSIFLPGAGAYGIAGAGLQGEGSCIYWSSTRHSSEFAYTMEFFSHDIDLYWSNRLRCYGYPVRPVMGVNISGVELSSEVLTINIGETATLTATVLPANASPRTVIWSSSDKYVATVSSSGVVTGIGRGSATITCTTSEGGYTATCAVTVMGSVPAAVDLGLPSGLKWASFNLGATKPEEYGDYYAWGETEPYYSSLDPLTWEEGKEAGYWWPSYKWCMGTYLELTKYCKDSSYGYNSFIDTKTVLDPEDDATHVTLGGNWRMPTETEWTELIENCTWSNTTLNTVTGFEITGGNGNSIFLPYAGFRIQKSHYMLGSQAYYWSSSLADRSDLACILAVGRYSSGPVTNIATYNRSEGLSIRPVCD